MKNSPCSIEVNRKLSITFNSFIIIIVLSPQIISRLSCFAFVESLDQQLVMKNILFLVYFVLANYNKTSDAATKIKVLSLGKCESSNNAIVLIENCRLDGNGMNLTYENIKPVTKTFVSKTLLSFHF